jgi:hypothetical protein
MLHRLVTAAAGAGLGFALAALPAAAAGGYEPAQLRCRFADPRISESSGVASASWSADVIWTHNDSGDSARFFAVDATSCATLAVYDVAGAAAVDWEDMTRSGRTLYFGDIGDNNSTRASVTVYEVPEPGPGMPPRTVSPSAIRVLTYPDRSHNAESLFVDPTTGRLVIVTKTPTGPSAAYRTPPAGSGVMEKVADLTFPGATTGGDASDDRIVVRTYPAAYEWDVLPGDTLAAALARPPAPIALPFTPQGEAIAYTADGSGLWTTSESQGAPIHLLRRTPPPVVPEVPLPAVAVLSASALTIGALATRRIRRVRRRKPGDG